MNPPAKLSVFDAGSKNGGEQMSLLQFARSGPDLWFGVLAPERAFFAPVSNLIFESAVNKYCDAALAAMHQARQKRTFKRPTSGDTSGAQVFENVKIIGHRYLNRADRQNHPANDSEIQQRRARARACRNIRTSDDEWKCAVATEPKLSARCVVVSVSLPSDRLLKQTTQL